MNNNLVSIIVPIYNSAKYLHNCIKSIINQTYKNIEIILINDGSSDSSLNICKSFLDDSRIKLVDKKNEGLSVARQFGIDISSGDYICTVDSDDYIDENFIEKMYNQITKDNSDICVCSIYEFSKKYFYIHDFHNEKCYAYKASRKDLENKYLKILNKYYMSDSWNKIYKKEFIINTRVRFFLSKEYNGTDLLFNHLLLLHLPKISIVNEPLYHYQIVENSRVRRKNKCLQDGFMIIIEELVNEAEKLNYSNEIYKQISILYLIFMRDSIQDIFDYYNKKDLKSGIKKFIDKNNKFMAENKRISLSIHYMNTFSLKIFYIIFKNYYLIILYLKVRKLFLKKIKQKKSFN